MQFNLNLVISAIEFVKINSPQLLSFFSLIPIYEEYLFDLILMKLFFLIPSFFSSSSSFLLFSLSSLSEYSSFSLLLSSDSVSWESNCSISKIVYGYLLSFFPRSSIRIN